MVLSRLQVGLNMHLYDDIGDASSSLRVSTSSFGVDKFDPGKFGPKNLEKAILYIIAIYYINNIYYLM